MNQKIVDSPLITTKTPIEVVEEIGKECTGCGSCCRHDSAIFLEEDAKRVADSMNMPLDTFKKEYLVEHKRFNTACYKSKQIKKDKPYGKCVFLTDDNKCGIHEVKPTHCRVLSPASKHGQQLAAWYLLKYLVNSHDAESIRQYNEYLQTQATIPGGQLHELVPDPERLQKMLNYEIL